MHSISQNLTFFYIFLKQCRDFSKISAHFNKISEFFYFSKNMIIHLNDNQSKRRITKQVIKQCSTTN